MGDRHPIAERPPQSHALTEAEQHDILEKCHRSKFANLPPARIIARLLDEEGLGIELLPRAASRR